jgi:predicted SAM-dependent methyltransferase
VVLKLQVGSGRNVLAGWLNTDVEASKDIVFLDVTKPFPFHNDTFNYIFTEHLIEHLQYFEGMKFLRECYRVLKLDGKLRVATPDLCRQIELYGNIKTDAQKRYVETVTDALGVPPCAIFVINHSFVSHKFLYDYETLKRLMELCSFVDVEPFAVGVSEDPNLKGLERHGCSIGEEVNRFESMALEARK